MRHDWPRLWASHSLIALSTSTARARNCIAPEPQMTIDTSHLPSGPPGPPGPCQARKEMLLGGLGLSLRTSGITAKDVEISNRLEARFMQVAVAATRSQRLGTEASLISAPAIAAPLGVRHAALHMSGNHSLRRGCIRAVPNVAALTIRPSRQRNWS